MANKYLVSQHVAELPIGNDKLIKFGRNYTSEEIRRIADQYTDTWCKDIGWYDSLDDAQNAAVSVGNISAKKFKYNNLFCVDINFVLIDYYTDTGEEDPYDEEYDGETEGFYPDFVQEEDEEGK